MSKKVQINAWAAYHIFIDEEVEVDNTNQETIESAIRDLCEQKVLDVETRPEPAFMEEPRWHEA